MIDLTTAKTLQYGDVIYYARSIYRTATRYKVIRYYDAPRPDMLPYIMLSSRNTIWNVALSNDALSRMRYVPATKARPYKARKVAVSRDMQTIASSQGFGEQNDCAVIALTTILELPYPEVHELLGSYGRQTGKGTMIYQYDRALQALGFMSEGFWSLERPTVNQFLQAHTTGRYIVNVSGHVFATINGQVFDTIAVGKARKVHSYWYLP